MTKNKKIAIITTHSFGYIDFVVDKLNLADNVDLTYINIDSVPFKYKNTLSRVRNFFSKLVLNSSLKEKNRTSFIKNAISKNVLFDQVLVVRPDKLETEAFVSLRGNSIEMSCFLFDGIENYKGQKKILHFFDTVYSYDKKDVEKYGFTFLTNYIYDDEIQNIVPSQTVFNISSYDKRFPFLEKIANYLKDKNISFLFIVKKSKAGHHEHIKIIDKYLPLDEVKKIISRSSVLVDIQKENQSGLSFRVFEALGYGKKLITNNQDIINYDFYNQNNICVISETNYEIPIDFFETDYVDVDSEILNKYKLNNWISVVFKVDLK